MKYLILLLFGMFVASTAYATDCNSPFVDETGTIANTQAIEQAVAGLESQGVEVRARILKSIESAVNLDSYVEHLCQSWRTSDGRHWKSTLLLLVYSPNSKPDVGLYYGVANQTRLTEHWRDILKDKFVPGIRAYRQGETSALSRGFIETLQALRIVFATPVGTATSVTINDSDYSWVGRTVLGLVIAAIGTFIVILALIIISRRREVASARNEARRVRSLCISGINEITDTTTIDVLEAKINATKDAVVKAALTIKLMRVEAWGKQALTALNGFDSLKGDDPNAKLLSARDYQRNQNRYADILTRYVDNARYLIKDIQEGNVEERKPTTYKEGEYIWEFRRKEQRQRNRAARSNGHTAPQQPDPPPPPPAATTVIREESSGAFGSAFTGSILGNLVADSLRGDSSERRRRPNDDPPPSYSSPSRSDDGGSFSSSSSSSDDGGSFSSSSSSDSGGSYSSSDSSSSSSDSGGSFSSSDSGGSFSSYS